MKNFLTPILFFFLASHCIAQKKNLTKPLVNAAALKNGVLIGWPKDVDEVVPLYKVSQGSGLCVTDERKEYHWRSEESMKFPQQFILEFAEDFVIERWVLRNYCNNEDSTTFTKSIKIEYSSLGSDTGFKNAGTFILPTCGEKTISAKGKRCRWVRLTILSNHGSKKFTRLSDFEAWGKYSQEKKNFSKVVGKWSEGDRLTSIGRRKNGDIYGCFIGTVHMMTGKLLSSENYHESFFYLTGKTKRNYFEVKWRGESGTVKGWARLVVNKEGTKLSGIWGYDENTSEFGIWYNVKGNNIQDICSDYDDEIADEDKDLLLYNTNLEIKLIDANTNLPLKGEIVIFNATEILNQSIVDGSFSLNEQYIDSSFHIVGSAKGYLQTELLISLSDNKPAIVELRLEKPEIGKTIKLENVLFYKGTVNILEQGEESLQQAIELMKEYPLMEIELQGHTDNLGDDEKNLKLSEDRVVAIKNLMIREGIQAYRIKTKGFGGAKPIADNQNEETRSFNRRVEFVILKM